MAATATRQTAEQRRESILDAAMIEFGLKGLHGTSTDDIARRAGISQPYLFRLFRTKHELFLATVERCFARTEQTFRDIGRGIRRDTAGLLKLIFSPADKKLLGLSIIGESATELVHIGMMVLDNGLTINEFIDQVFNYPTLSEMYKYAAYDGLGNLSGHKLREG